MNDEISIYTEEAAERIYQTVTYACGHAMLRAEFRKNRTVEQVARMPREITDKMQYCRHCRDTHRRYIERRKEERGAA